MSTPKTIGAALVFLLLSALPLCGREDARGFLGYQDAFESAVQSYREGRGTEAGATPEIGLAPGVEVFAEVERRGGAIRLVVSSGAVWALDQLSRAAALERVSGQIGCLGEYAAVLLPAVAQGIARAPTLEELAGRGPGRCDPARALSLSGVRESSRALLEASLHSLFLDQEALAAVAAADGSWRTAAGPQGDIGREQASAAQHWVQSRLRSRGLVPEAAAPAGVLLDALRHTTAKAPGADPAPLRGRIPGGSQAALAPAAPGKGAEREPADWTRVLAALLALTLGGLAWAIYDRNQHRRLRQYYEQSFYQTRDSLDVIAGALGQHRFVNLMRLAWEQSAQRTSDDP